MAEKKSEPRSKEERLVSYVDSEFERAMGAPGGQIALERAKAWDAYLSKPLGNEVEGQTKIVSSDVSEIVDSIIPSLLRLFTTADNLVSFDPVGPEDEKAAQQASDYVNYVFFKQNPAFLILFFWFFDALVQKNGVVKAWWDEKEVTTYESYSGLTDEELEFLAEDEELEIESLEEREGDVVQPVQTVIGTIPLPLKAKVNDVTFRRTSKRGKASVASVPPEEYRISSDANSPDPGSARMVGQEREVTRSELIEMGFSRELVESIPAVGTGDKTKRDSPEKQSRHDKTDEIDDAASHDKSQDRIVVREAYIKFDWDGDGKSELRQVITANGKLLSNEPADRQPFHVLTPHPLPHKHFGKATAEKVMDIQAINTTLIRQIVDNLHHTNNPGHAVWERAIGENTLDDLLTTRIGRIARFDRPVAEAWAPMTVPFTAGATFPMLEFFDKVKRDRTGVSSDSQGLSPDALKNIQVSVLAQAADLSRMKIEAIARIFAETGIKSLFLHLHELLLKHQDKATVVKLRNEWVEINPQEWRTRTDMTVNIGLGIGTREQNLVQLAAIRELQQSIKTTGGQNLIVLPQNEYRLASEFVKNANLKQPEMFFTDPGDALAAPPPDEQAQLQRAQMELEARRQQLDAERQQINAAKIQLQAQKQQLDAMKERIQLQLDAAELARKTKADQDKLVVEMEKIKNELTKLELDSGRNVPGSAV